MIELDEYGRAFTRDKFTAYKYRMKDRQVDFHAIKNGLPQVDRWVNFTTREPDAKIWRLPPALWKWRRGMSSIDTIWDLSLYWYQKNAVSFVHRAWLNNKKSAMVVSWTATGKSHIILWLIYLFKVKTIIVVPNSSIGKWLYDKISPLVPSTKFWTADQYRKSEIKPDVLILNWLSFNNIYDELNGKYEVLLMDETHHLSNNRKNQCNKWKGIFICWVTATPERKEYGIEWFIFYFGEVYNTEVQALPVTILSYEYEYDYSAQEVIKASEWLSPDSPELYRRLYCANTERTGTLNKILAQLHWEWFKKIIIFTDRVYHIEQIQELVPWTVRITGQEPIKERAKLIDDLAKKDSYTIVAMSQCVGEWFDLPALECWILFMSTSRNNTIEQTAGRMRRYSGDKEMAYMVDFIDHIQIMWGKTKKLWRYERLRMYKQKSRTVKPLFALDF